MKEAEKLERIYAARINLQTKLNTLFKWNSTIELPRNIELILRTYGSIGYSLKPHKWVVGQFTGEKDDLNEYTTYIAKGLATGSPAVNLKNHDEVIVCGNNCRYKSDKNNIFWDSIIQANTDISMYYQLVNSRNIPVLVAPNDKIKKQIDKVFEGMIEGKPGIITTDLMSEVNVINMLDPANIEKMECLTSFYEQNTKRTMNQFGASLDVKDKKAQVNNMELKAYDDFTTLGFLAAYESRLEFCEEMKKNGINIECIRNPIFADEPTDEDIDKGTREQEEFPEEGEENEDNIEGTDKE